MKIDIIIVNYKKSSDTVECVHSLLQSSYPFNRIYIVDNDQDGLEIELCKIASNEKVLYFRSDKNLGFAGGVNKGIRESLKNRPDYVLLINNDTIVSKDFLSELVLGADKNRADISTGKILYYDKKNIIWGEGGWIDWKRGMGRFYRNDSVDIDGPGFPKEVEFISGCLMLIKSNVFDAIGFFDECYFMYCEDIDFCLRAKKLGLKLFCFPGSEIWHKVGIRKIGKSSAFFYYFVRNSIFIIKKYARPAQFIKYTIFSPLYFIAKLVCNFSIGNLRAIISGIRDGVAGRCGERFFNK